MPNHYLNLTNFESVRHFFKTTPGRVRENEVEPLTTQFCEITQRVEAGVAREFPLSCGLTGGRDTRFILACCKPFLDHVTFFSFRFEKAGRNRPIDIEYPKILATRYGLNHLYIYSPIIDRHTDQLYQMCHGFSTTSGQAPNLYVGVRENLDPNSALLTGFGGYPRAHWWNKFKRVKLPATPRAMVHTFNGSRLLTTRNVDAMTRLMSGIRWDDVHDLLDILHIEQRTGSWSSPMMYSFAPMAANLIPFTHRGTMLARLRYPKEIINRTTMMVEGINYLWPELSELPYNKYSGLKEIKQQVKHHFKRYRRRYFKK